jgi:hypothetical protein
MSGLGFVAAALAAAVVVAAVGAIFDDGIGGAVVVVVVVLGGCNEGGNGGNVEADNRGSGGCSNAGRFRFFRESSVLDTCFMRPSTKACA